MPIWEMDKNLCRTYLADIYQDSIASSLWEERDIWWFQMKGNTNFYNDESSVQYYQAFQDILNGCMLPMLHRFSDNGNTEFRN